MGGANTFYTALVNHNQDLHPKFKQNKFKNEDINPSSISNEKMAGSKIGKKIKKNKNVSLKSGQKLPVTT